MAFGNSILIAADHGTLTGLSDDDHPQYVNKNLATAKGSLLVATAAGVFTEVGVGTNNQTLKADSTQAAGMKWAAASSLTVVSASVDTSETTTSGVYTNLATSGPAVTITVGSSGIVEVIVSVMTSAFSRISFEMTGANVISALDKNAAKVWQSPVELRWRDSFHTMLSGLNQGSTTFTMKYVSDSGTATFSDRRIEVIAY